MVSQDFAKSSAETISSFLFVACGIVSKAPCFHCYIQLGIQPLMTNNNYWSLQLMLLPLSLQALKEFDLYDDTHRLRITVSNMKNGNSRKKLEDIKTAVLKGLNNIAAAPGAQFAHVPPRHQIVSFAHLPPPTPLPLPLCPLLVQVLDRVCNSHACSFLTSDTHTMQYLSWVIPSYICDIRLKPEHPAHPPQ